MSWKPDIPFKPRHKLAVHAVKRALSGPDDTEAVLEAVEALRKTLVRSLLQDGYSRADADRMAAAKASQQTEEIRQQLRLKKPDLLKAEEFRNKRQKPMNRAENDGHKRRTQDVIYRNLKQNGYTTDQALRAIAQHDDRRNAAVIPNLKMDGYTTDQVRRFVQNHSLDQRQ